MNISTWTIKSVNRHPLTRWRRDNDKTMRDVATAVGTSSTAICRIELRVYSAGEDLADRLAQLTGLDASVFKINSPYISRRGA